MASCVKKKSRGFAAIKNTIKTKTMSITRPLGGERLNTGKRMDVHMHGYERSTHNLSRIMKTTMSPGTLVPFINTIGLPGDTWDITLEAEMMTHPTIGPLFGSYKWELDMFQAPIRLYNALLHNNMLGIGRDMTQVKLPMMEFTVLPIPSDVGDLNNCQINPSCILKYLGLSGFGYVAEGELEQQRQFQMTSLLAYWETVKNYFTNKQEKIGAVIHVNQEAIIETVDQIEVQRPVILGGPFIVPESPAAPDPNGAMEGQLVEISYTGATPKPEQILLLTDTGWRQLSTMIDTFNDTGLILSGELKVGIGIISISQWRYQNAADAIPTAPRVVTFPLSNIDDMRYEILKTPSKVAPFLINDHEMEPYRFLYEQTSGIPNILSSQEGLAVKTYNSDLFNNWLNTENLEAVTDASAIDTSGGYFTIDQLLLGRAVYNLLNRINVAGGTYDDWLEVVYDHEPIQRCESPIYHGGLIKELVFQEVTSNTETSAQPLGTLAGKGRLTSKHKGGRITIKVDEPTIIMGIMALTPRIDYSQGNEWHMTLKTLDDLHKPQFDQIGFQDLMTTQMTWWDSVWNPLTETWDEFSAGKQPAWINYMTDVNKNYGNFAIENNEMFMVLDRRYEFETNPGGSQIKDLTTYIDPGKFNNIFAQTSIDAQNFWAQVQIKAEVRRKMSAKIMPTI